jgi:hypothetical protein
MEVHKGSQLTYASELDLGSVPATDVGVLNSEYHAYYPVFSVKDAGNPVQFLIPGSNNLYINLDSSILYLKNRIMKSDGSTLSSTDLVSPTVNYFRALFSSCEVSMNSTVVSRSASLFPYRGHILDTLAHGNAYKTGKLASQIYIDDTKTNDFSPSNSGFVKRAEYCKNSAVFEVLGKLSESVFDANKFFPPEIDIRITLRRSDPAFCLDGPTDVKAVDVFPYKIEFEECTLFVRKYTINPLVVAQHHKILNGNGKLHYPLKAYELRNFNISSGTQTLSSENLFRNTLPQYVVVTFLESASLTGNLNKSCYNFTPAGIQSIKLTTDGESTVSRQIDLDVSNKISLLAYNTLFAALSDPENGISISRDKYLDGSFFVVLDLIPNQGVYRLQNQQIGQVQLDLKFKDPLTSTITCLVVGMFETMLTIDKNKSVNIESYGI